jgi:DNA primase
VPSHSLSSNDTASNMQRTNLFNRSGEREPADEEAPATAGMTPPLGADSTPPGLQPARTPGEQVSTAPVARRGAPAGTMPTLMQRIKDKMPLLDYVKRFRDMKASPGTAGEYYGKCISPDHKDDGPSFYVSTQKQVFHCKGCGISGNVVQAYAIINNMSDEDAKFALGRELGVMRERRLDDAESMLSSASSRYIWQLGRKEDALSYLRGERRLTDETIARFGIGFCWGSELRDVSPEQRKLAIEAGLGRPENPELADSPLRSFMAGRITFPVRDRSGRVVGYAGRLVPKSFKSNGPKYLNTPETPWFHKSELLYGAYEASSGISKSGFAAVVEGYMDVVALHQSGVDNAVAVMGASANEKTFLTLWAMTRRIVFCLDGDAAGDAGALRSVLAAAPTMEDGCSIEVARLPSGVDPDEFVLEHGADAFRALCERATPLSRFLMEARAHAHDLSYPEGRARFMSDADEVAGLFSKAPLVREQIIAEARSINNASLVQAALDITGIAENVSPEELRGAIALMQRRLAMVEAKTVASPDALQADNTAKPPETSPGQPVRHAPRPR